MDADRPLKKLFQLRARDLLALTGDRGARVVSRQIPELAAVSRRLDFVIKLERHGEIYLRHLEFEMHRRGDLASRMFEYAAALAARHGLPVVSTAIILKPPAHSKLVYEERVGGRVVCWRRIRVVRLWRMKPATAMRLERVGPRAGPKARSPRHGLCASTSQSSITPGLCRRWQGSSGPARMPASCASGRSRRPGCPTRGSCGSCRARPRRQLPGPGRRRRHAPVAPASRTRRARVTRPSRRAKASRRR